VKQKSGRQNIPALLLQEILIFKWYKIAVAMLVAHPPYQAIHLADPYRSNYGPWPLKFADPPADNGAADDGKLHSTKNRKKRMQQKDIMLCARSAYVFPHFILDKVFLGIDFIETTRCAPGDALQWAPSL